jgi:tetratricopeptide (TPR) repeat protein
LIRHLVSAALLATALAAAQASAADQPPAQYAEYVAAARKAEAIRDERERCLAYPDLPGNEWAPGVAKARCIMFLTPPAYSLDSLEKALAQPDGAKAVDARFQRLLDEHFTVPDQREQIFIGLFIFNDDDHDRAERVARAWLAASPGSPFANTALALVLERRGWDARGAKFIRETPAENVQRMEAFFVEAAKLYATALGANPKLLPACHGLMSIGRQSSDVVQAAAMKACIEIDPASYYVVDEMMTAAEPRWGGSEEAMRAVAAYAQARVKENPVLAVFAFHHAFYEAERADDGDAQRLVVLEPASAAVPNAAYLRSVGGAYLRKDQNWKAFVYLSQALRFAPSYPTETRWRAYALQELGETEWAKRDAERVLELDPKDAYAQRLLADILRDGRNDDAARPHYELAMREPKLRQNAYVEYCATWLNVNKQKEAGDCIDALLKEFPDNGEAWRMRLSIIGPDAPGSIEAMKKFLAAQDPGYWPRHKTWGPMVTQMLALKENKDAAPTPEMFTARAWRAEHLERTPEGKEYLSRLIPATGQALTQAMSCFAGSRPGESFTTVMDVMADGSFAHVEVSPVNARSTCYAKRIRETAKAPPPPASFAESGFPLVLHTGTSPPKQQEGR